MSAYADALRRATEADREAVKVASDAFNKATEGARVKRDAAIAAAHKAYRDETAGAQAAKDAALTASRETARAAREAARKEHGADSGFGRLV